MKVGDGPPTFTLMIVLHLARAPFETTLKLEVDVTTEYDTLYYSITKSCKQMSLGDDQAHVFMHLEGLGEGKWKAVLIRIPKRVLRTLLSRLSSEVMVGFMFDDTISSGQVSLKHHHLVPPAGSINVRLKDLENDVLGTESDSPPLQTEVSSVASKPPWYLNGPTRKFSITQGSMKEIE